MGMNNAIANCMYGILAGSLSLGFADPQPVLFSSVNTIVCDRAVVRGQIRSNSYIELGVGSKTYGDMVSSGNLVMRDRAYSYGRAYIKGTVTQGNQTLIEKGIAQTEVSPYTLATKTFLFGTANVDVYNGIVYNLIPGNYGDIHVYSNGKIVLGDGIYNVKSLILEPDAKIDATVNSSVSINAGSLSFGDRSRVNLFGMSNPLKMFFYTNQTNQVYVGCDSKLNLTITAPNAQVQVQSRADIKGKLEAKNITLAPDAQIELIEDTRFVDSDHDNVPDNIEIELGSNPNSNAGTPSVTTPSPWGVGPESATKSQLVLYSTPAGGNFDVEFPAGSVTSYYYPYIENLKALPAGTSITLSPGEKICSIHRFHGQLAGGAKAAFSFHFSAPKQNIGSNSMSVYVYKGGAWQVIDTKVASEGIALTNVGDMGLYVLAMKSNVLLVNGSSTCTSPDGKTWVTAYPKLTQALSAATAGSEIWVAAGVYYAGTSQGESFEVRGGISLLGGFDTKSRYYFDRDPKRNVTILSGDIGEVGNMCDNTAHIIKWNLDDAIHSARIDGFTISDGQAAYDNDQNGGGIYMSGCSLGTYTISNCTFRNNTAGNPSRPVTSGYGGAIYMDGSPNVNIDRCVFINNISYPINNGKRWSKGGAVYYSSSFCCSITNTYFLNNNAAEGGAIFYKLPDPGKQSQIQSCVFTGNDSGAVCANGNVKISNCTFTNNPSGGARFLSGSSSVANTILWNNGYPEVFSSATCYFSHCCVEGGVNGSKFGGALVIDDGTSISSDPRFNDATDTYGPDGELGTDDDGMALKTNSPCYNAGVEGTDIPQTDIRGNSSSRADGQVNGAINPDIGAYWLYLSEYAAFPAIDFLPHKDHPYGFDRIVGVNTYYYTTPDEQAKVGPDSIFMSMAFDGQGADVPNKGLFRMVVDPRGPQLGHIDVSNPVIQIKDPDGGLVNQLAWGGDNSNVYTFEIVALEKPSGGPDHSHYELNVWDNYGNVLRKLNVELYTVNNVKARIYGIYDSRFPDSKAPFRGTVKEYEDQINKIYSQAVTKFTLTGNAELDIPFDLNGNGALDLYTWQCKESDCVEERLPCNMQITDPSPEWTIVNKNIPLQNTAIYTGKKIYNWFIVPNPTTGASPKAGDKEIYVLDPWLGYDGMRFGANSTINIGYSGSPSSEAAHVTESSWAQGTDILCGIFKVVLDKGLACNHVVSVNSGAINGETVWLTMDIGNWGIVKTLKLLPSSISIFVGEYISFAHEFNHAIFGEPHYYDADMKAGAILLPGIIIDPMKNIFNRNLMNRYGGVWLNKRLLKTLNAFYGTPWYNQWDQVNGIRTLSDPY